MDVNKRMLLIQAMHCPSSSTNHELQSVEIPSPTAARRVHAGPGIMIHGAQSKVVRESQGIPHITSTHPEHFLFHFIPLN